MCVFIMDLTEVEEEPGTVRGCVSVEMSTRCRNATAVHSSMIHYREAPSLCLSIKMTSEELYKVRAY